MKQEQNDQYVDGIKLAPCLLIGHHVLLIGLHVHHVHQVHYVYNVLCPAPFKCTTQVDSISEDHSLALDKHLYQFMNKVKLPSCISCHHMIDVKE